MATATNNVIDLADPECLRRERERKYEAMRNSQSKQLDGQLLDAIIKSKTEELETLVKELRKLRNERAAAGSSSVRETSAREWLRHSPPRWIAERLRTIDVLLRELRAEYDQPLRREQYLIDQRDEAQGALGWPKRVKIDGQLAEVRRELEAYQQQRDALQNEKRELIRRCVSEAWPEPIEAEPVDNTRKAAGNRTSKPP